MSIGTKIRELREARNMSLEDVAKLCGTTRQTIYKYENEIVTNIPYDKIILLATALNTTPSQLFDWKEDKKRSPHEPTLTEGEEVMLELFRQIPEDQQPMVISMIRAALCTGK
jgi:transcriptional regulator with XRE-family HTH domain